LRLIIAAVRELGVDGAGERREPVPGF
jgi:hypothetical protein